MNQENLEELSNKVDLLTNNNLVGNNKSAKSDSSREKTINGTHDALGDINRRTGRNMPQAIATAVLLVAVIIACLVISIDAFVILLTIFMVLALWELHVDFATAGFRIPFLVLSICSVITILSAFYARWHAVAMASGITASLLLTVVFATLNSTVSQRTLRAVEKKLQHPTSSKSSKANTFTNTAVSLFVVLYIPLLASCIVLSLTNTKYAIAHAMLLVFLPALSDTGGLFAGAWLGKHKLSPRISPKKSIEGLLGSMLFALIGAYAIISGFYGYSWIKFWWMPAIMGVASGMVGTFGDLCASMLKRDIGIKDMGHLLKGHGGVLDRVDSILLCAPVLMALIKVVGF
ncbi:CDP-diglyceride synthetase [Gardnerella vaginalis]|uniref:phosphatidate cytidylyltransferase n=1 Tax=Gardnerella vaginalis TaxID=2702 RepID=UPI000E314D18|nr:phosphatidate cytidylyltransferase [Gardnerella vaginalis]RFD76057.1 CDP-diglyceride synthetase [Gardnerella vaginalis]